MSMSRKEQLKILGKQQFPQEYQALINDVLDKYMLEHTC